MVVPAAPSPAADPADGTPADASERPGWAQLTREAKRDRILAAATAVFSQHGLEAPMHDVAAAAGAGVASIYRLFGSKHGLFAALVIRRMQRLEEMAREAEHAPGDRWSALVAMISEQFATQSPEPFVTEARALVEHVPEVAEAIARTVKAQERVLAAARAEGRLRADASTADLRLLFAATRAARRLDPDKAPRMLELMLDAFDTRRGTT